MPAWNAQRASSRGPPSRKGSLSIEDTFESISELGPLELMGRELDLAPYGTLRKSQSADSLNSVSSVSNNFGQDFTLGQVEVSMDYDAASHTLHVAVLQGKDLLEREEASFESCFMRVSLLPDEQIVGISRVSGGLGAGQRVGAGLGVPPGSQESGPGWQGCWSRQDLRRALESLDADPRVEGAGYREDRPESLGPPANLPQESSVIVHLSIVSASGPGREGMTGSCWLIWGGFGNRTVIKLWWYVGRPRMAWYPGPRGWGQGKLPRDHCVPRAIWIRTMSFG